MSFGDAMFAAGHGQGEVVVVLCPEHVGYLGSAGWSKADVKSYLSERARRKVSEWLDAVTRCLMGRIRMRCWRRRGLRTILRCWLRVDSRGRFRR